MPFVPFFYLIGLAPSSAEPYTQQGLRACRSVAQPGSASGLGSECRLRKNGSISGTYRQVLDRLWELAWGFLHRILANSNRAHFATAFRTLRLTNIRSAG